MTLLILILDLGLIMVLLARASRGRPDTAGMRRALVEAAMGRPEAFRAAARGRGAPVLMKLALDFASSVRGPYRRRILDLLAGEGLEEKAARGLGSRSGERREVSALTLGLFGGSQGRRDLLDMLRRDKPGHAIAAASALASAGRECPARAVAEVLLMRDDISSSKAGPLIEELYHRAGLDLGELLFLPGLDTGRKHLILALIGRTASMRAAKHLPNFIRREKDANLTAAGMHVLSSIEARRAKGS